MPQPQTPQSLSSATATARERLDAHVREIVKWHFDPATGCPFWLDRAKQFDFNPLTDVNGYDDLGKFGFFEDEWLRGGPVGRWVPKGYAGKPIYVFETGGSTGVPKSRINHEDFRIDYSNFSDTLPEDKFPLGSNWLMVGPSGPRRLRLAIEHLAQHRGGICFMVDLDPRWVIKLIKKGWTEHLQAYKDHVIDQAVTILGAGHDIKCLFTTPKLLESLALRLESMGTSIHKAGITGIFSGGTEFTPQWNRFAHEELLDGAYMTPTYGNTLMGLAASSPSGPHNNYKITYYAPQPRAVTEVVDLDDPTKTVEYGADRARQADDADEGVLHARLSRARRRRARGAVRPLPMGWRQRRAPVPRAGRHDDDRRLLMIHLPVLRWGQPYTSMEVDDVVHFSTGEPIARVSRANGGLIGRDMRKAHRAREVLREIPIDDLIARVGAAGELYMNATLPMGDGTQSPDEFARAQSASTGLPERMCRANMKKNGFVLAEMRRILTSLTRGLSFDVLSSGYGEERGVPISFQAQSPVLGLVLPSNSPGVHTLWLPIIPMQIGLVLKPGPQEPWTPYRMAEAFFQAGIPREAISVYPGGGDVGAAVLDHCERALIFGGTATVDRYRAQRESAGARPRLLEDPPRRRRGRQLGEVSRPDGRERVREQRPRVHQLLRHLGEPPHARDRRRAGQAARGHPSAQAGRSRREPGGVHDSRRGRCDLGCDRREPAGAWRRRHHRQLSRRPARRQGRPRRLSAADRRAQHVAGRGDREAGVHVSVRRRWSSARRRRWSRRSARRSSARRSPASPSCAARLIDAVHIDRLNLGPVPTIQLNWLQPHEGNIVEFLFRARAFQTA